MPGALPCHGVWAAETQGSWSTTFSDEHYLEATFPPGTLQKVRMLSYGDANLYLAGGHEVWEPRRDWSG